MTVSKDQAVAAGNGRLAGVFHSDQDCTLCHTKYNYIVPARWRPNGICQVWKRSPGQFKLPIKWGLYKYSAITEMNADDYHHESECPYKETGD